MSSPLRDEVRNDIIESFADSEYALARDLAACREALHVAVEQLHEVTCQHDRLREDNRRLRDECRRLRQTVPDRDERRAAA